MFNIETCWDNFTSSKNLQPSTLSKDKSRYTCHILPYWKENDLETIKFKDIIAYQKHLFDKGLAPQTVRLCLSQFHSILRRSVQLELFSGKIPHFEMPKVDNRRMRFLTFNEAQQLLSALYTKSELWHDISFFALHTGMRAGEIFSLTKNSINFTQNNIIIYKCKNAYARIIPLNQTTINIAKKYAKKQTAYLFTSPSSPEKMLSNVSKIFSNTVKSTGLNENIPSPREKIVFHSLRHTFASWLVQTGTSLIVVSNLLGHKSLQMTLHYAHLAPDQDKAAVDTIHDILSYPYIY